VAKIKHTRNENGQNLTHQNKTTLFWRKKKAKINLRQNFPIYGVRNIKILRQTTITHSFIPSKRRGCHGRDRMVLGFTTTYTISAYHYLSCELESHSRRCALDAILFDKVCQGFAAGGGFLRVLRFPLPLKLTTTIELTYC
jgi:hypothetical protein